MKADIIVLNSKDRKLIRQQLVDQFGITELFDDKVLFCFNKKERVYLANKELFDVQQDELRTNMFGLYIGTFMIDGFRLSIEGAQLLGPQATKNILSLSKDLRDAWLKGEELEASNHDDDCYLLLKYENDFLGVGKKKGERVLNYLPKSRKLKKIFGSEEGSEDSDGSCEAC